MVESFPNPSNDPVIVLRKPCLLHIVLNRPDVLNSLNRHMVRIIGEALDKAEDTDEIRLVVFSGAGERGFCAGGDIKLIARAVQDRFRDEAMQFFEEEYALDLRIHRFPKPVVAIADGITMGGGLGLCAGADIVIATERTRMAMPETRIGFFPDVGATGWLFRKCVPGYPEFLALTGYEAMGPECVRIGLATHLAPSDRIRDILGKLEGGTGLFPRERQRCVQAVLEILKPAVEKEVPGKPDMDEWVRDYFSGRESVPDILEGLKQCGIGSLEDMDRAACGKTESGVCPGGPTSEQEICKGVFGRLSQRSPSAVVWTLALLRYNERRDLEEVFKTDLQAALHLTGRNDFREGVRARLIDRDDRPEWIPGTFDEAAALFDPSGIIHSAEGNKVARDRHP